jgi:ArsR family transcriptional regulator
MDDQSYDSPLDAPCPCPPEMPLEELLELQGPQADERLAELAKALAHPVRVGIVRFLAARDGCVCNQIVEQFNLAQSTISQHLKILKEAGLVRGTVDGPRVCYCLDRSVLTLLQSLTGRL